MPASKQEDQQNENRENPRRTRLSQVIGEKVLDVLGQPSNLYTMQVCKLWDDHYRVNVFIGDDAASATIAHSFFLLTDADGNIVAATPKITKRYSETATAS